MNEMNGRMTATEIAECSSSAPQPESLADSLSEAAYKSMIKSLIAINKNLQDQNDFLLKEVKSKWNGIESAPIGVVVLFYNKRYDTYHVGEKQDTGEIFAIDMGDWLNADDFSHWMQLSRPN